MDQIVNLLSKILEKDRRYIMTCVSDRYHDRHDYRYDDRNKGPGKSIVAHDIERGALIDDVLFYEMKDFYLKETKCPRNTLFIKVDGRMVAHILPEDTKVSWKMKSPELEKYIEERAEVLQERVFKHIREANAAELAQKARIKAYDEEFAKRFGLV